MLRTLVIAGFVLTFGVYSLSADVSACTGTDSAATSENVSTVNRFIAAVRAVRDADDRDRDDAVLKLANRIVFPLVRKYPLPSIRSVGEFMIRYKEVFDDDFISMIVDSDDDDCGNSGGRGLQMHGGLVSFRHSNAVMSIDYESDVERQERIRLIEIERKQLHESLREYSDPVLEWETCTYRIRIDRTGDGHYRYAAWRVEESHASKPDIIVDDGQLCCGGSLGAETAALVFQNGEYKYVVSPYGGYRLTVYRTDLTDPLEIVTSGEVDEVLDEPVVNAGLTGLFRGNGWYTRIADCR